MQVTLKSKRRCFDLNKIELREDERIDQLYANDIKIIQSSKVFSFSLDAVLLAHFAEPTKKENGKVVDLCAGNGAVGLFLTKGVLFEHPY